MKKLGLVLAAAAMVAFAGTAMAGKPAGKGNLAPSGSHFTLNLVGVEDGKKRNKNSGGSVIFVRLGTTGELKKTTIQLCNTTTPAAGQIDSCDPPFLTDGFIVIDGDGTSETGDSEALFGLPNPDPDNNLISEYSLFIRGHGKVGTSAEIFVCGFDGTTTFCDTTNKVTVTGGGGSGGKKFANVTRELLFIDADLSPGGPRIGLFTAPYEDLFWEYDNKGLRVAQLRFYPCATTISGDGASFNDDACFD